MSGETIDGEATAETVRITGHQDDEIPAYLAHPPGPGPFAGVVVLHHMPGYDEATRQITQTFAANGYTAIMPNLHWRDAPGASPDDASAAARAAGGVPDERLVGDVDGAARYLRSLGSANGKVGVIGYCSGGRQAFLAARRLTLDAAVDCYGAFVMDAPPEGMPLKVGPVVGLGGNLSCPRLGVFEAEDTHPSPAETARHEQELARLGKTFEFHTYRAPATASSPSTGRTTGPRRQRTAGGGSSTSSTPARDRRPGSPSS
jgi:carboxymethylenebutenolidase